MKKEFLKKLRYPIGKFDWNSNHDLGILEDAIIKIKIFPSNLTLTVSSLNIKTLKHQ